MKKKFLAAAFLFLSQLTYSQSNNNTLVEDSKIASHKDNKILKINTSGYSKSVIKDLREELITWTEKVEKIEIDESNNNVVIVHNLKMDPKELFEVLNKYIVTKTAITSYQ